MARRPGNPLAWLTALNLALLALLVAAEFLVAERLPWTTLATYLPQHPFCLPTALLLLAALFRRRWRLLAWNAPALAVCVFVLLGVNVPWPRSGEGAPLLRSREGTPLRVMQFNVGQFDGGLEAVARAIERERPDIVFLEEVNTHFTATPSPALRRRLAGWHYAGGVEVAIFSRHPIVRQRSHPIPHARRIVQEAVIRVGDRHVTALCAHLIVGANQGTLWRPRESRAAYLRHTARLRALQVDLLLQLAARSSHPVILAGDFNTPPRGRLYPRLCGRFTDAFAAAGWGPGYTWPARLPLMRIDYIWLDRHFTPVRCYLPAQTASDHYPVVADVLLRR